MFLRRFTKLFAAALPAIALAGCSLRYDESSCRTGREACPASEYASVSPASADADSVPHSGRSLLGLRLDRSVSRDKAARAACRSAEPCATPSPRELREARAAALAEADLVARTGGPIMVKADGSSSNPAQVRFAAAPGALAMALRAAEDLNAIDGSPHALTLVVYHLSDRVALDRLAASEEGMYKLLEGEFFDESVMAVRRIDVQPGMRNKLDMARAENGRYVALVAGYNRPRPRTSLAVFSYGIGQYSVAGATKIHRNKAMFCPLPLNLRVELGDDAMVASETGALYHNMRDSYKLRPQEYYFEVASRSAITPGE